MQLPGGYQAPGGLQREVTFKPLTGEAEIALAMSARGGATIPVRVTEVLTEALDRIGDQPVNADIVRQLSVADRQVLMRELSVRLGRDEVWLSSDCTECGSRFDFPVRQSSLPVKPALEGYPYTTVETERGRTRVRVPNGADQEAIAGIADEETAITALVERLVVGDESMPKSAGYSADELRQLSEAIETMAPEVSDRAVASCPQCGNESVILVDPYLLLQGPVTEILAEVHLLASRYRWNEPEILALPTARRREYVRMIDRERGMTN